MRILVINPNSTASMTAAIGAAAQRAAAPGTTIVARNPADGPPAIQGAEDGAAALPGLFALFETEVLNKGGAKEKYDAVVIACFDDTGLRELKARSPVPVLGIGEAGFLAAMLVAERFSVVTTLAVSLPVIEANLAGYGWAGRCAKVRASGIPVLDLEAAAGSVVETIAAEIDAALAEDGCGAVVLGCAGMADLAEQKTERFGIQVIDGVAAAVAFCEALQRAGVGNSRPAPEPLPVS
ncbi:MAG: aspartate/glutamate racemase family protein [Kiloniellaceae bacterium]